MKVLIVFLLLVAVYQLYQIKMILAPAQPMPTAAAPTVPTITFSSPAAADGSAPILTV